MTLLQLQVFVAVCQEKSFTRAGDVLNMTQSAISQAVANLENELGVRLLVRDRQRITLTHIGERVLSHARDMIQHTIEMKQEAEAAAGTERGTLRIGVVLGVTAWLLPGLLASFRTRHPDIQTTVVEGRHDEVNSWLANHSIDVGLTTLNEEKVNVVSLVRDPFLLFVRADHPLAQHTSVSLEQIQHEPYIQLKADGVHIIKEAFKRQGVSHAAQFELGDMTTIMAMVQQGLGVAILPELAIPNCTPDLIGISLDPPVGRNVGLMVRDMKRISPICAEFILHASQYAQDVKHI